MCPRDTAYGRTNADHHSPLILGADRSQRWVCCYNRCPQSRRSMAANHKVHSHFHCRCPNPKRFTYVNAASLMYDSSEAERHPSVLPSLFNLQHCRSRLLSTSLCEVSGRRLNANVCRFLQRAHFSPNNSFIFTSLPTLWISLGRGAFLRNKVPSTIGLTVLGVCFVPSLWITRLFLSEVEPALEPGACIKLYTKTRGEIAVSPLPLVA